VLTASHSFKSSPGGSCTASLMLPLPRVASICRLRVKPCAKVVGCSMPYTLLAQNCVVTGGSNLQPVQSMLGLLTLLPTGVLFLGRKVLASLQQQQQITSFALLLKWSSRTNHCAYVRLDRHEERGGKGAEGKHLGSAGWFTCPARISLPSELGKLGSAVTA